MGLIRLLYNRMKEFDKISGKPNEEEYIKRLKWNEKEGCYKTIKVRR